MKFIKKLSFILAILAGGYTAVWYGIGLTLKHTLAAAITASVQRDPFFHHPLFQNCLGTVDTVTPPIMQLSGFPKQWHLETYYAAHRLESLHPTAAKTAVGQRLLGVTATLSLMDLLQNRSFISMLSYEGPLQAMPTLHLTARCTYTSPPIWDLPSPLASDFFQMKDMVVDMTFYTASGEKLKQINSGILKGNRWVEVILPLLTNFLPQGLLP